MTRHQVRQFDARAIADLAIPGVALMENAGRNCAEVIIEHLGKINAAKVCIFCGTGNNGGDGFVIARHLNNHSLQTSVVICGDRSRIAGDALINLRIIEKMGIAVETIDIQAGDLTQRITAAAAGCDMLIDGLFGTGLSGRLRRPYPEIITCINSLDMPIAAIDIPSGLDCDTGKPLGEAIRADFTVTFVAIKKGFVTDPGASEYTGNIYIASIGIEP